MIVERVRAGIADFARGFGSEDWDMTPPLLAVGAAISFAQSLNFLKGI